MKKLLVVIIYLAVACKQDVNQQKIAIQAKEQKWPESFGFGRAATKSEIAKIDIDISPDGEGLPPGEGKVSTGKTIYVSKCAACHGVGKEPDSLKMLGPILIAQEGTKLKTIGNYWPYATTLYDYIRRAMPFNSPGSLTNEETYHLTAYLLYVNKVIKENKVINAKNLADIEMPAHDQFVDDDRQGGPEVK